MYIYIHGCITAVIGPATQISGLKKEKKSNIDRGSARRLLRMTDGQKCQYIFDKHEK